MVAMIRCSLHGHAVRVRFKRGADAAFVVAQLALATSAVASGLVFSGAPRVQKPREVGISDSGQLYTDRRTNPIHVE